ncbi:hypothetical protein BDV25DRAFT_146894 [Aspergillus avenaceus]|uniref:Uncharacterized protein n=1 Tax=Aspergillus avenaceus TaxID=36643 RepID=A0A5N6U8V5_ASPAV|nr:hypothetical protein BDV25DRAFT_146894 [Aspergillus avenaceus]
MMASLCGPLVGAVTRTNQQLTNRTAKQIHLVLTLYTALSRSSMYQDKLSWAVRGDEREWHHNLTFPRARTDRISS